PQSVRLAVRGRSGDGQEAGEDNQTGCDERGLRHHDRDLSSPFTDLPFQGSVRPYLTPPTVTRQTRSQTLPQGVVWAGRAEELSAVFGITASAQSFRPGRRTAATCSTIRAARGG